MIFTELSLDLTFSLNLSYGDVASGGELIDFVDNTDVDFGVYVVYGTESCAN